MSRKQSNSMGHYNSNKYQKRRTLINNGACEKCEKTQEECVRESKNNRGLDCHHSISISKFRHPRDAHFMENMTMLCRKHHSENETRYSGPPSKPGRIATVLLSDVKVDYLSPEEIRLPCRHTGISNKNGKDRFECRDCGQEYDRTTIEQFLTSYEKMQTSLS